MWVIIDIDNQTALTPNVIPENYPEAIEAGTCIEAPDWIVFGDTWTGTEWLKTGDRTPPEPEPMSIDEKIEHLEHALAGTLTVLDVVLKDISTNTLDGAEITRLRNFSQEFLKELPEQPDISI